MARTWIVVAESSRARIFQARKAGQAFEELADLVLPKCRLKGHELLSDAPGRAFDSKGQGRHAMSQETDVRRHEAEVFANELADKLEAGRNRHAFDSLILVAPPEFLGLIRAAITPETGALLQATVNKNMIRMKPDEIRNQLKT